MMTIHRQQTMQGKLSAQKSSLHQHKGKIRLSILVHVKATYLGPSVYSSSIWVCALYFEEHTCRQLHMDIFVQVSPTPSHKLTVAHVTIFLEKEIERGQNAEKYVSFYSELSLIDDLMFSVSSE